MIDSSRLTILCAALMTYGCALAVQGDDDSDASPTPTDPEMTEAPTATPVPTASPTPPEPTPTPTPTALPATGYRISELALTDDGAMDLDGDDQLDAGFIVVYEASVDVISDQVFAAAYSTLASSLPPEQARLIAMQLEAAVDDYYAVTNLNSMFRRALTGEYLNWVQLIDDSGADLELSWYSGVALEPGAFGADEAVGRLNGRIDGGAALFGPGGLELDISDIFGVPGEGDLLALDGTPVLVLDDALAAFHDGGEGFSEGRLGGVLWRDDMLAFMSALVPSAACTPNGSACVPFEISASTAADLELLYDELEAQSQWPVQEGGEVGVAVGFTWAADHVPVLTSW